MQLANLVEMKTAVGLVSMKKIPHGMPAHMALGATICAAEVVKLLDAKGLGTKAAELANLERERDENRTDAETHRHMREVVKANGFDSIGDLLAKMGHLSDVTNRAETAEAHLAGILARAGDADGQWKVWFQDSLAGQSVKERVAAVLEFIIGKPPRPLSRAHVANLIMAVAFRAGGDGRNFNAHEAAEVILADVLGRQAEALPLVEVVPLCRVDTELHAELVESTGDKGSAEEITSAVMKRLRASRGCVHDEQLRRLKEDHARWCAEVGCATESPMGLEHLAGQVMAVLAKLPAEV